LSVQDDTGLFPDAAAIPGEAFRRAALLAQLSTLVQVLLGEGEPFV
jgi:hypothetical protein